MKRHSVVITSGVVLAVTLGLALGRNLKVPRAYALSSATAPSATAPSATAQVSPLPENTLPYPIQEGAWRRTGLGAIRGATIGPIENRLHPDRGYGSEACARTMREVRRMGGNWVSITPFGRIYNLSPTGISLRFEAPFSENKLAVKAAVAQAHAEGLRVLLVPHLWVETGEWRALVDPKTEAGWTHWAEAYGKFVSTWAKVAEDSQVDMLAIGVELRKWVTLEHAKLMVPVIEKVRRLYHGPLTYAANWDDVHDTVIWQHLDVIGINAFYPLADNEGASDKKLRERADWIAKETGQLARAWGKPIVFTEFGYTTRNDPAVRPWEWPEHLKSVTVNEADQARAYQALLSAFMSQPWFVGVFVWRLYADPNDVSQEPEWGFSPRGKLAEMALVDAFAAHWAADGPRAPGTSASRFSVNRVRGF